MKKLGLTFAAIGLFFATAHAQVTTEATVGVEATESVAIQDDFKKIDVAALPATINEAITKDYAGSQATEAYIKESDEEIVFKIELQIDQESKTVFADAEGNWIDQEDVEKED
ncbi:hypothetical protein L1I30_02005 [Gillisia sp. M10.2A]|uniref:PepSY domain-containing protein n=1 Tax=Gillisia lutea TaxID=2909668 RepID=A0ABS9EC17_9FLAO|nr:hypothetical protein [Gillisia lutea]MCF4100429.1 hypothetical protein [Gillisia lutea]